MALKDTVNSLRKLLGELSSDLEKAAEGNKAASQRVRTGTIKLAKVSKQYRKESVTAERKGSSKPKRKAAKPAPAKAASKSAKRATAKLPVRRK